MKDRWTAVAKDGSYSAHFEHCVAVTRRALGVDKALRGKDESSSVSQKNLRKCKLIHREGVVRVICVNPKHKQRQG